MNRDGEPKPNQPQPFDQWLQTAKALFEARNAVHLDDLPDQCYADWHARGFTPDQAARLAAILFRADGIL